MLLASFCFHRAWTLYNRSYCVCQCSFRYRYLYSQSNLSAARGLRFSGSAPRLSRAVKCIRLLFHDWSPESVKMAMCSAIRCVSAALPLLTRPAHIWTCQNSLRPNVLRTLYTSSRLSGGKNFTELRGSSVLHLAFSFAARTAAIPVCILVFMHFYFKCSSLLNAEVCFWTEFVLGFNVCYFGSFVTSWRSAGVLYVPVM